MIQVADEWRDFELIDSGEGEKLERWGQYVISRPDPRAIWNKTDINLWKKADAQFISGEEKDNESWHFNSDPPKEWVISYKNISFRLKPTEFKHTGVFPEQAVNWDWINQQISRNKLQETKVLNLFAYTGGATIAAAKAGAKVTHVDASRPAMMWASENCKLNQLPTDRVRWIQDDALKFVQREIRRGIKYDAIIMDPPKFGRGAGGEVWKMDTDLPKLVWSCKQLLSDTPSFWLINGYTADLSHIALKNLLGDATGKETDSGELGLRESSGKRILPAGIWARWSEN